VGQFEQLERDFQEVLTDLVGDQSLERFRIEYEKLHRALKKSVDNEKRLIKKCRELNAALAANAAKVDMALRLTSEDQQTIQAIKAESEKAWKMVEAVTEKEARARETIQHLKLEVANLTKLLEQGAGLAEEESSIQDLKRERDMLAAGAFTADCIIMNLHYYRTRSACQPDCSSSQRSFRSHGEGSTYGRREVSV